MKKSISEKKLKEFGNIFGIGVPLIFGFGIYERDLLNKLKIVYNKYIPCGSLKYGIYSPKYEFQYENYFVETQYLTKTSEFILTRGGYYNKTETKIIKVNLEFNSNFFKDSLMFIEFEKKDSWVKLSQKPIDLNGKWLRAGRITDEGEKRRDISKPRKTMKFLKDGNFQWIAFNTETFQFFGSGGGTYSAKNGIYTENIQFFSRNNNSVG